MDLPRRRFGGVDPEAARAAVDEQRRLVAELTAHLARVEGQLQTVTAERDAANARLTDLERQIADVLRLATRAASETELETAARVAMATQQAQQRVDDLAIQAAVAADTAAALAASLQEAVRTYRTLVPIDVSSTPSPAPAPTPPPVVAEPEEPFVLDEEVVVVEEEPEAPTPEPAEQPPAYTSVVARPLPSPAAAVDVEQRLVTLPGVREVTLAKLGSTEATFTVAHDPGDLDLSPLTRLGVPVALG